jgi:hypothetical protein
LAIICDPQLVLRPPDPLRVKKKVKAVTPKKEVKARRKSTRVSKVPDDEEEEPEVLPVQRIAMDIDPPEDATVEVEIPVMKHRPRSDSSSSLSSSSSSSTLVDVKRVHDLEESKNNRRSESEEDQLKPDSPAIASPPLGKLSPAVETTAAQQGFLQAFASKNAHAAVTDSSRDLHGTEALQEAATDAHPPQPDLDERL